MSKTLELDFDFATLTLPVERDRHGRDMVPLKPICERLGLDWALELARVQEGGRQRFGSCLLQIQYANQRRNMHCIRLDRVVAFMATIDLNSVPTEGNEAAVGFLLRKQKEWAAVLWRHSLGQPMGAQH